MASMEHPLFTLATRPDRRILRYEHGQATIEVTPSVKGLATIHDKDVLIYCVSQLMAALNEGRPTSPRAAPQGARPPARHQPRGLGRRLPPAARGARAAVGDAHRHQHRRPAGSSSTRGFGLIDAWEILRKHPRRADDPDHGDALGLDVPLGGVEVGADAAPRLFPPPQAARAAGLRDRPQALRPAGRVADRARGAAEEIRLDLAAAGVPQDDPRHGRGGRAARLQPRLHPRRRPPRALARPPRRRAGRTDRCPATRGSLPRRMPAPGRRRPATTPTGSRRNGCGSGAAAAARRCAAPRRPSSPSAAPAPPAPPGRKPGCPMSRADVRAPAGSPAVRPSSFLSSARNLESSAGVRGRRAPRRRARTRAQQKTRAHLRAPDAAKGRRAGTRAFPSRGGALRGCQLKAREPGPPRCAQRLRCGKNRKRFPLHYSHLAIRAHAHAPS